jgi:8-oxo-dGTP diphosphatase
MAHDVQADGSVHGVVFGCRRADGRWLMIRRSPHLALAPDKVCFPGGGVCVDESPEDACVREAREELGVTIRPLRLVWRHAFGERPILLRGYLAEMGPGPIRPDPAEVAAVLWLSRSEALAHPDGLPTNAAFIDALERAWRLTPGRLPE